MEEKYLEEILKKLDLLEKQISVLDRNIKIMSNSIKLLTPAKKAAEVPKKLPEFKPGVEKPKDVVPQKSAAEGFKNFKFESSDAAINNTGEVLAQKQRTVIKNIVVTGKMMHNFEGKPVLLPNVSVKIFNDKDIMVKETRTNRAGIWVSHLPGGKYVALFEGEFNGKKLVPQNRNFVVPEKLPDGKTELEVI